MHSCAVACTWRSEDSRQLSSHDVRLKDSTQVLGLSCLSDPALAFEVLTEGDYAPPVITNKVLLDSHVY